MGEHPSAVQALPPEEVVRESVGLRPVQLGGEEAVETGGPEQLGQGGREPEAVRQPAHPVTLAELPFQPRLPPQQLPRDRFSADHVHVGLDPHAAGRLPAAPGGQVSDPLEELGIDLANELVGLAGAVDEGHLRVAVQQVHHRVEGAPGLASGLLQRPQPGEVDVGLTGQSQPPARRVDGAETGQVFLQRGVRRVDRLTRPGFGHRPEGG